MQNFNTNQTRHLYVANAYQASTLSSAGDIKLVAAGDSGKKKLYLSYMNADGVIVRSDTIDQDKIVSIKYASTKTSSDSGYASMARPLMAHKIVFDTNEFSFGSDAMIGKVFNLKITVHGVFDYDENNTLTAVASVVGNATNTATAAAFYKALAQAIVAVIPKNDPNFPFFSVIMQKTTTGSSPTTTDTDVTGGTSYINDATAIVLVEHAQKYVMGKLSGEPCSLSIASSVYGKLYTSYDNAESIAWAIDTVGKASSILASGTAATLKFVHPLYQLKDLEYFSAGERGDYYRGSTWPNNYEFEPMLPKPTPSNFSTNFRMISIEYYWAGDAENVQKSPRLIEVVGTADPIASLKSALTSALS